MPGPHLGACALAAAPSDVAPARAHVVAGQNLVVFIIIADTPQQQLSGTLEKQALLLTGPGGHTAYSEPHSEVPSGERERERERASRPGVLPLLRLKVGA